MGGMEWEESQGCHGHRCPTGKLQAPAPTNLIWGGEGLYLYLWQYFTPLWWQERAPSPPSAASFPGRHDPMLLLFNLPGRRGIISNEAHVLRTCNYNHWVIIYVLSFCAK